MIQNVNKKKKKQRVKNNEDHNSCGFQNYFGVGSVLLTDLNWQKLMNF